MKNGADHRGSIFRCDEEFENTLGRISNMSEEEVALEILSGFLGIDPATRESFEGYLDRYPYWGSLHVGQGDHDFIKKRAAALHAHIADFRWLYHSLCDYRSRLVLYVILRNWTSFCSLECVIERPFSQYFDMDLMRCDGREVFVDAGAYTGDTALSYIGNYGRDNYKRIYCYEITPQMQPALAEALGAYRDIIIRPVGLSDRNEQFFVAANSDASSNALSDTGLDAVRAVTLDNDVHEPVTFIKMDIEGGEQAALRGCEKHIKNNRPKLAISVYHNNEDIWKIPRMIEEYCPGYRFYLRYHGRNFFPTELILLAVHSTEARRG